MDRQPHRRDVLRSLGAGLLCVAGSGPPRSPGCVTGHAEGAQAGVRILAAGGNAVDAAVTAALVAGVVSPQMCGPGGYGGHIVIARPNGRVVAIDFNTAAPRAARPDLFPLDDAGQVRGRVNAYGWLAVGVPGTLAGMQLALDRHGTRTLRQVLEPAIAFARNGFERPRRAGDGGAVGPAVSRARRCLRPAAAARRRAVAPGQPFPQSRIG